jgi:hypothetical protein
VAQHTGTQFVTLAARYVGVPYVWGGASPRGFDCSGLVYYVLGKLGIQAPRTSEAQYAWTKRVSPQALRPGDLVFLNFPGEQSPGHVMIWLGGNKVLQAPAPGQKVQVSHFDPQAPGSNEWGATVVGYGRIPGLSYKGEPTSVPVAGGSTGGSIVSHIPIVGGAVSGAEATASFFGKLLDPHFWLRAVEVLGGFLILMLGLYLLTRQVGVGGVPEPPTPGLSDETLAELSRPPGSAARPRSRPRRQVHEVSDAADRRRAIRARAERADQSGDIPF